MMARRWSLIAILVTVLFGACSQGGGQDAFTERVAAEFRKANPDAAVTVTGPRTIEVRFADGTSLTQSLDNLWLHCTEHPESCDSSRERVVRAFMERQGMSSSAVSRESVLPTLRDRAYLDGARQQGVTPVARPFLGDFWKVYVFDLPDSMRLVAVNDLKILKLTEDELDTLAMDNLSRKITTFPHEPVAPDTPVQVLHAGDSYEASRLLLLDRWSDLKKEVKGDLLVSAPSRDWVYFTGSEERPEALAMFRKKMENIVQSDAHPLSAQVLRWAPEGWVIVKP